MNKEAQSVQALSLRRGSAQRSVFLPAQFDLIQGNLSISWGSFLENALAQEFSARIQAVLLTDRRLGEVDFLLQRNAHVLPVGSKVGKDFRAHAALDNILRVSEWGPR